MSDESETKVSNKFQSSDILKSLNGLVDQALQICEFNSDWYSFSCKALLA